MYYSEKNIIPNYLYSTRHHKAKNKCQTIKCQEFKHRNFLTNDQSNAGDA